MRPHAGRRRGRIRETQFPTFSVTLSTVDCTACVAECPVEAIFADGAVPAEYQSNIEFNAAEARRVKDSGQEAIAKKKDPLPTAAARKAELGY